MGGETLHRRDEEHPTGPDAIQIHGGGTIADRLRVGSETKAREVEELRARIAGLLKENADLQTWVADWNRKIEEAEARAVAAVAE